MKTGTQRAFRRLILQHVVRSSYRNGYRQFSSSKPRRINVASTVDLALQVSYNCFQGIHTITHLPWSFSILLTGVLFRLSYLPVQYYINRQQRSRAKAVPLLVAWKSAYQVQARLKYPQGTPNGLPQAEKYVDMAMKKKRKELEDKYGRQNTPRDVLLALGFLPVWLCNAICLRQMAGFGIAPGESWSKVPIEPDLANGGLLWIPDLTIPDPLLILPVSVGVLQLANWWNSGGQNLTKLEDEVKVLQAPTPERLAKRRTILFLAFGRNLALLSAPFLIWNAVPSAMVLYMMSSVGTTLVQKPIMRRIMRMEKPVEPAIVKKPQLKPEWEHIERQRKVAEAEQAPDLERNFKQR